MQISNSSYNIRQVGQADSGNGVSSPVNKQQEIVRIDRAEYDKESQSNNHQKNRLDYDQTAIELIQQQSSQLTSNQTSSNQPKQTGYDQPTEQNLSAVAAYESIENLSERAKIQQVFGVDLLA